MARLSRVALLVLLSFPGSIAAQEWRGGGDTVRVGFEEQREGGALAICELTFTQVLRDDVHRQNAVVTANAILGMAKASPTRIGFMFKFVGQDQSRVKGQTAVPFSPSLAYVSAKGYSSAHREHQIFQCEGPGFCASYFGHTDFLGLLDIALSPTFTTSFQRRPGDLDVSFLVRLSPDGSVGTPAQTRFAACASELIKSAPNGAAD